jgi:hypothetical protein
MLYNPSLEAAGDMSFLDLFEGTAIALKKLTSLPAVRVRKGFRKGTALLWRMR